MDAKRIYQYSNPGRLVFGAGSVAELRNELGPKERPLVVTDPGIARTGVLQAVTGVLEGAGVTYSLFDGVEADPPLEVVDAAAARYRTDGCTRVVAVGGGSSIDVAKAVSVVGTLGGTVAEYCTGRAIDRPLAPVVAVPTTAGTGSEATAVAVISDHVVRTKRVLKHDALVPRLAILDPKLLASLPARIAADTGADALTHAVEACLCPAGHPLTDALSTAAVRAIFRFLPRFVADRTDLAAAGQMLLASHMAGQSFKNAGLGLAHSMAHPVGVYFHVPHGASCALYLPAVIQFNAPACAEKVALVAEAAGVDARGLTPPEVATAVGEAIRGLFRSVGVPSTFAELGVDFRLHPEMLDEALTAIPTKMNPRQPDRDQLTALFHAPAAGAP